MLKIKISQLTQIALLIALEIVLTRFCAITTPIVRIGFGFLPIALIGMLYGPVWAGLGAAIADILGVILFPFVTFSPGFTLTAALTGVVYGALLYRDRSPLRIVCAVLIITLGLNLCLDTVWIKMLTGKGYLALLPTRVLKCVIMAPVQIAILCVASSRLHLIKGLYGGNTTR